MSLGRIGAAWRTRRKKKKSESKRRKMTKREKFYPHNSGLNVAVSIIILESEFMKLGCEFSPVYVQCLLY